MTKKRESFMKLLKFINLFLSREIKNKLPESKEKAKINKKLSIAIAQASTKPKPVRRNPGINIIGMYISI